ncbi:MAG: hypothetical protein ACSHX6_05650 [Akkermansiaceae bacterium]
MMLVLITTCGSVTGALLEYVTAPPDNPLRGLVPYVDASKKANFPHSMEFRYFSLRDIMKGPDEYDWEPIERALEGVSKRGNQIVFRVFCEYPGRKNAVPQFLIDGGVKITKWKNKDDGEISYTPDYENPKLRESLTGFIRAMGVKYDGDPRIGFITAGVLGSWGEWHTYPREDLWASKEVQLEILDSFAKAFSTTKVLLRYAAGGKNEMYAENVEGPFGYHDDSFGWATIDTGKKNDSWFFEPTLKAAGAMSKWKSFPIGGEIRPELWKKSFTAKCHSRDQGFVECVERLHVTWLMDTGLFDTRFKVDRERREAALKEVARMGYELYVSKAEWNEGVLSLLVENRGVAPFYYDWPVEVELDGKLIKTDWKLSGILPGEPRVWSIKMAAKSALKVRVPNPMNGGKPLRFANRSQGKEWLEIKL